MEIISVEFQFCKMETNPIPKMYGNLIPKNVLKSACIHAQCQQSKNEQSKCWH